jgi:hypothetical protein
MARHRIYESLRGIECRQCCRLRKRENRSLDELEQRLEDLGREIGEREAAHSAALEAAGQRAGELRADVSAAIDRFNDAVAKAGAPQMRVIVSDVRADDKHVRSFEFEVYRGRHRAIVTVKSRAEVTLVGPFRSGKVEGPCRSFPLEGSAEFDRALVDFLGAFVEEAATP